MRPGRPKPRASIASARLRPRSSEPATSGESSAACPRSPSGATPRPRSASTSPRASRSSVGTSRVASAAASTERRAVAAAINRSWSSSSAYTANASPTAASRSAFSAGDPQLLGRDVERARAPGRAVRSRARDSRVDWKQRREQEQEPGARTASPRGTAWRGGPARRHTSEQHGSEHADRHEARGEQRADADARRAGALRRSASRDADTGSGRGTGSRAGAPGRRRSEVAAPSCHRAVKPSPRRAAIVSVSRRRARASSPRARRGACTSRAIRRTDGGLRADDDRRPHLAVVAVHERLGERTDDDGHAHARRAPSRDSPTTRRRRHASR